MRAWNRAKLLWGYLRRQTKLKGLPVEYIVETTAKCNLYCPMCPRETHKQPKEDMADDIFNRLVAESGSSAEHMMLIGLGEPFMDPKIFERIEYYRKGARFEKVRDNFVRFAGMKQERRSPMQVVVQMVRMERNAGEVEDF